MDFRTSTRIGFFFFNDTATTEIYTLSLHDALPISRAWGHHRRRVSAAAHGTSERSTKRGCAEEAWWIPAHGWHRLWRVGPGRGRARRDRRRGWGGWPTGHGGGHRPFWPRRRGPGPQSRATRGGGEPCSTPPSGKTHK